MSTTSEKKAFKLTIAHAVDLPLHISDFVISKRPTIPNPFVKIKIDQVSFSLKTNIVHKSTNPVWDMTITLSDVPADSPISIRIVHKGTMEHTLCSAQTTISKLLQLRSAGPDTNVALPLQYKDKNTGTLFIRLTEQDAFEAAKSAVSDAQLSEAKVTAPAALDAVGEVVEVVESASSGGGDILKSLTTILGKIDILAAITKIDPVVQVVDELAKVHPYANLAWKILSSVYQVIKNQMDIDEKISGLVRTMETLYAFVDRLSVLRSCDGFADHVAKILNKTIECGTFLQEYAGHSLAGRAVRQSTSNWDEKIKDFKTDFAQLHENLQTAATIETVLVSFRMNETFLLDRLKPSEIAHHAYSLSATQEKLLRRTICTNGTRVHLLAKIKEWVEDASPKSQSVYWLFGHAGTGKSTIAYTVASQLATTADYDRGVVLGGSFFCSRHFGETKEPNWIIRTIAYQLARTCKPFARALLDSGNLDVGHGVQRQIQDLLVKPWRTSETNRVANPLLPRQYLVVIDALDEIEGDGGPKFLRTLFDVLNKSDLSGLKFFVTSRPDPHLVTEVSAFERKELYRLQAVKKKEIDGDIETYLKAELPHFANGDEMGKLVTLADGLFISAATVVRYLAQGDPAEQTLLLPALFSINTADISDGTGENSPLLDELYRQILAHAFVSLSTPIREHRLRILHAFLCTAEPTSETVVAHLLSKSGDDIGFYTAGASAVFKGLHAVLYTESGRVLSYHKSFTDFLFDRLRSRGYWCDRVAPQQLFTDSCFRVMNSKLTFNIAKIPSSYILNSALSPEEIEQRIPNELGYSCQHWSHHLRFAAPTSSDYQRGFLSEFLGIKVLFWIEAMNVLGLHGQCDPILRAVADWVRKADAVLAGMFTEAANFAVYFSGSLATLSAPHLYISALATWPGNSQPSQGWKACFPRVPAFTRGGSLMLMTIPLAAEVYAVAVSSDGNRLVSGSGDDSVRIWNASTGELLKVLDGHTDAVLSVAFSTDGDRIVSGSQDKSVRIWNASTGESLKVLDGHTDTVYSVAFSTDGDRIVSGSWDKSVRIWNASTGESLKVLDGHTNAVWSVAFSTDGDRIVSGSHDKSVRIWVLSLTPQYLREYAEDHNGARTYTGWLLSLSRNDRLMFVPPDAALPDFSNILTISRTGASSVDFIQAALGPEWQDCYAHSP